MLLPPRRLCQAEVTSRAVKEMTEGIVKERRRNIQERFAMAIVMDRLQQLKRSLDQNTEGDKELRESVEAMQRQMAHGDADYAAALEAQRAAEEGVAEEDRSKEHAAAAELLELETKIKAITAESEAAEERMKAQADAFIARERAVAEMEAQVCPTQPNQTKPTII